ncbi:hypothetical protein BKA66DRAFT_508022 [Pyrenochaeta sp. MPI-SDFR-AT-0127]|nr:hypothetical protein BKA66DRAFT_508022 [Pyrenochaeta sp. MPI-SDFR-AT-0127]
MAASSEFLAESIGLQVSATASMMIAICTTFVGMRYYARYLAGISFSVEDVVIPFAWLAEIGLFMVEKAGTGRHMAYVLLTDPSKISKHFKGVMAQEVLHPAAVALPKLTVVFLYLQIMTNKYERMIAKILIFLISATCVSYTIAAMFQCIPFAFNWDKTIPGGKCFNVQAYGNSSSVPNILTDLVVLVLPLRTVLELKISTGRRVGLLLIFLTGSMGIIASIVRTVVFVQTFADSGPLADVTYIHVTLINWTIIEPGMYLLCACALSFKPLFRSIAKGLHLHAFITHTRLAFVGSKSHAGQSIALAQLDTYDMEHVRTTDGGKFHRWSENSMDGTKNQKKIEVLVTRTVDMHFGHRS